VAVVTDTADVGDYAECCADAALMAAAPMLKAALMNLSTSDADSDPCWCSAEWRSPSWAYHTEHSPTCRDAREALAASAPPPTAAADAEDGA
jgi:hypothetical protein